MATVNYDYSFTPNTAAKATEVNANFNKIKQFTEDISTGVNIDAGAISTAKIADAAVTTAKIANASVTVDKLANAVPRGVVAKATRVTNTSSGATVNCFDTAVSFTPVAGRLYKVSFSGFIASVFTDYTTAYYVAFVDSSNNVLQYIHDGTFASGVSVNSIADSHLIAPSTTTAITLNVRVIRTAGTDTFYFNGAANKQNYLLVEDLGLA